MKVIEYRHSFNGISSFRAWLYGIARNTSADAYRKQQRVPIAVEPSELNQVASHELQDAMEDEQRQDKFSEALHQLPEDLRDILILHRYQQLRYDEIAELFGINLNTLKSKMRKAVSELHKHYSLLTGGAAS
jgi:RNA polymerase sigma-70 factor (ECF subfamily)